MPPEDVDIWHTDSDWNYHLFISDMDIRRGILARIKGKWNESHWRYSQIHELLLWIRRIICPFQMVLGIATPIFFISYRHDYFTNWIPRCVHDGILPPNQMRTHLRTNH